MRVLFTIAVTSMVMAGAVWARLGETVEESRARYHVPMTATEPLPPADAAWGFGINGVVLLAGFTGDRCSYVCFQKRSDDLGMVGEFSEAELATLLATETTNSSWQRKQVDRPGARFWQREDLKAMALYDGIEHMLFIGDAEWFTQAMNLSQERKRKAMDGF